MLFCVSTWALKTTRVTRPWSAGELRTPARAWLSQGQSVEAGLLPIVSEAPSPSQAEEGEVSSPFPQPGLLLSTAQLTPIQAADTSAQGVSELRYLWMPFCVAPLAPAQLVPSLFQQLPNDWGDRLEMRHGLRAGPQWGQGETASIPVDIPPFYSFYSLYTSMQQSSVAALQELSADSRLLKKTHTNFSIPSSRLGIDRLHGIGRKAAEISGRLLGLICEEQIKTH